MTIPFQARPATLDLPREQIAQELTPIADLMSDPTVKEIQVRHGGQHVLVEREGQAVLEPGRTFPNLEDAIRTIAGASGRDVPPHRPALTVRLEEFDARLSAILPPLARGGALMTIRRFPKRFTLDELVERSMLTPEMAAQLRADIRERRTVIVSGEGGSGKSTLVHAMLLAVPAGERMFILETNTELVSTNPYVTQLEASGLRHAFDPGRAVHAPVELDTLLEASLLHSPGRITIGEVTGPEALPMIMAWTTGHPGGFCTVHASSAADALRRLAQCALMANGRMSYESLKADIARVVHISIHLTNRGGTRFVDQACRVTGYDPRTDQFLTAPY
jgi:pilus assembly protein CpaF